MGYPLDPEAEKLFQDQIYNTALPKKEDLPKKKKVSGSNSLDLHGMSLIQAIERCRYFLNSKQNSRQDLSIITGAGKHSPGIFSVLKQGIGDFLLENKTKLRYNYQYKNGVFTLWFD